MIQFCESWDSVRTTTGLAQEYDSAATSAATSWVAGVVRGFAIRHTQSETATTFTRIFSNPGAQSEYVIHFRLLAVENAASNANHRLVRLFNGGTEQFQVRLQSNVATGKKLKLVLQRGDALGISGGTTSEFSPNVPIFVEVKVRLGNSLNGSFEVRLNGVTDISGSGISTSVTTPLQVDRVTWELDCSTTSGSFVQVEDLVILDTSSGERTDFLGDVVLEDRVPNGAGDDTDWTPLFGDNWENVDDSPNADDDSSYNSGGAAGELDLLNYSDLGYVAKQIVAVVAKARVRNDVAGTTTWRQTFKDPNSVVVAVGDVKSISSQTYAPLQQVWEVNPVNGNDWKVSDRAQFGYERVS